MKTRRSFSDKNASDFQVFLENNNNQELDNFDGKREHFLNTIDEKGRNLEDNVGSSITRMDGEIQKSLSHQKAENSRLQQQITQLKGDNTVIKNQLLAVQKRIEDIELQVGRGGFGK